MTKRMLIMTAAMLLLAAALALGFWRHVQALQASAPRPGAQTVTSMRAAALSWQPQVGTVGTVTAAQGVDIAAETAGVVEEVRFRDGQDVRAGDVLVRLNSDTDRAQLQMAEAAAEAAATVLRRDRAQLAAEAISQAVVDGDAADLKAKQAAVAQQAALVARKTIRAPFAGRLGISTLARGQYLNPGDRVVTLQALERVRVGFTLPQEQVAQVATGQTVRVVSDAFPGEVFAGRIGAVAPKIDTATRSLQVQAEVANPSRRLLPGMYVRVDVSTGSAAPQLTLPQTAIAFSPYGSTVYRLRPPSAAASGAPAAGPAHAGASAPAGTLVAEQVFVTTGATRGDQVAVLTGIAAGDEIVTSGQLKLRNGTPVRVDNRATPADSADARPQER